MKDNSWIELVCEHIFFQAFSINKSKNLTTCMDSWDVVFASSLAREGGGFMDSMKRKINWLLSQEMMLKFWTGNWVLLTEEARWLFPQILCCALLFWAVKKKNGGVRKELIEQFIYVISYCIMQKKRKARCLKNSTQLKGMVNDKRQI